MSNICQHLYIIGVEVWFSRKWEGVWLWRISGSYSQRMMWMTLRRVLVF